MGLDSAAGNHLTATYRQHDSINSTSTAAQVHAIASKMLQAARISSLREHCYTQL